MKQFLFFALKEDLLSMLELVEIKGALRYARMGDFQSREAAHGISIIDNGAALPHLGTANASSQGYRTMFLKARSAP